MLLPAQFNQQKTQVKYCAVTVLLIGALLPQSVNAQQAPTPQATTRRYAPPQTSTTAAGALDELRAAREALKLNPDDAKSHFQLAEVLRKLGRQREAAQEFLDVTELDPKMYLAYHQLSLVDADDQQLDEAIERLNELKADNPKEMMLRVALSELLEKRKNFYQAARVLIDMVYDNSAPEKFKPKLNARIHFLLTKAKDAQLAQRTAESGEEELGVVPAPLPETNLRKGYTNSKVKESREMRGVGHVPLLQ